MILTGHYSPETAYVVDDYPYGFRLRCKIRYWIDSDTKRGDRFCSQTTNPKVAMEYWNEPKKSTYSDVMLMVKDESNGHINYESLSAAYSTPERIASFVAMANGKLNPIQEKALQNIQAISPLKSAREIFITAIMLLVLVAPSIAGSQADSLKAEIDKRYTEIRTMKAQLAVEKLKSEANRTQCKGVTKAGMQCKRMLKDGEYCSQHSKTPK